MTPALLKQTRKKQVPWRRLPRLPPSPSPVPPPGVNTFAARGAVLVKRADANVLRESRDSLKMLPPAFRADPEKEVSEAPSS